MTVQAAASDQPRQPTRGGIYDAPLVGRPLGKVRDIADCLEPASDDSRGVRVGKRIVQGSAVAGAAGVAMIVVL